MSSICAEILEKRAIEVRRSILEIGTASPYKAAHYGGALSAVEIMLSCFLGYLRLDAASFNKDERDRFVLSKGHGCLALYAVLENCGLIKRDDIKFEIDGSTFSGHPVIDRLRFLDFSTGSLGNGLGLAVGAAIAKPNSNIACLIGDGELGEGLIWEAARVAANLHCENLVAIIDCNGFQQTGRTSDVNGAFNVGAMFRALHWLVFEIDGHDAQAIAHVWGEIKRKGRKVPAVIVAKTIKGKGVEEIEGSLNSHHVALNLQQNCQAKRSP